MANEITSPEQDFREALPEEMREQFDDWLSEIEHKALEVQGALEERLEEHAGEVEALTEALHDVKYWMLNCLVHHRPMTDPRAILRKVEDTLG